MWKKSKAKKAHAKMWLNLQLSVDFFFLLFVAEEKLANLSVLACTGGFVACFLFLSSLKFSSKAKID